jgi:hypothetical protein
MNLKSAVSVLCRVGNDGNIYGWVPIYPGNVGSPNSNGNRPLGVTSNNPVGYYWDVVGSATNRDVEFSWSEFALHRPWVFSWVVPIIGKPGVAGIGPAGSFAWIPDTHTFCGSLGGGASVAKNATVGPLTHMSGDADRILSGWSVSAGANVPLTPMGGPGIQATAGQGGAAVGPSWGVPGIAGSVTFGVCAKLW